MDYVMKKYLISPFFAPIFFSACWLLLVGGIFVFAHKNLSLLLEEYGILENITNIAYIPLWITYICLAKFFFSLNKNAKIDFVLYVVLGISAFLRELGIQHWLASKDTTAFKSRFFLNPNNPISEKNHCRLNSYCPFNYHFISSKKIYQTSCVFFL